MQRKEITLNEDIDSIMSEGPGREESEREFAEGGFSVLVPARGGREADDLGMTSHRGALHPDEYVDSDVLRATIEDALGFTYEDVSSVYRQGPLAPEQRQLRDCIDSRLLALLRSGGNMTVLADVLTLSGSVVDRALARAKAAEVVLIVKNPAVRTRRVSFVTGELGAKPQRRRHKGCPSHMFPLDEVRTSYVNLTDDEYAQGYDENPGNPAYWQSRLGPWPSRGGYVAPEKPVQTFPADWPSDAEYAAWASKA